MEMAGLKIEAETLERIDALRGKGKGRSAVLRAAIVRGLPFLEAEALLNRMVEFGAAGERPAALGGATADSRAA